MFIRAKTICHIDDVDWLQLSIIDNEIINARGYYNDMLISNDTIEDTKDNVLELLRDNDIIKLEGIREEIEVRIKKDRVYLRGAMVLFDKHHLDNKLEYVRRNDYVD